MSGHSSTQSLRVAAVVAVVLRLACGAVAAETHTYTPNILCSLVYGPLMEIIYGGSVCEDDDTYTETFSNDPEADTPGVFVHGNMQNFYFRDAVVHFNITDAPPCSRAASASLLYTVERRDFDDAIDNHVVRYMRPRWTRANMTGMDFPSSGTDVQNYEAFWDVENGYISTAFTNDIPGGDALGIIRPAAETTNTERAIVLSDTWLELVLNQELAGASSGGPPPAVAFNVHCHDSVNVRSNPGTELACGRAVTGASQFFRKTKFTPGTGIRLAIEYVNATDACGVCHGDNSTCTDACGIANGDNTTCTLNCTAATETCGLQPPATCNTTHATNCTEVAETCGLVDAGSIAPCPACPTCPVCPACPACTVNCTEAVDVCELAPEVVVTTVTVNATATEAQAASSDRYTAGIGIGIAAALGAVAALAVTTVIARRAPAPSSQWQPVSGSGAMRAERMERTVF